MKQGQSHTTVRGANCIQQLNPEKQKNNFTQRGQAGVEPQNPGLQGMRANHLVKGFIPLIKWPGHMKNWSIVTEQLPHLSPSYDEHVPVLHTGCHTDEEPTDPHLEGRRDMGAATKETFYPKWTEI